MTKRLPDEAFGAAGEQEIQALKQENQDLKQDNDALIRRIEMFERAAELRFGSAEFWERMNARSMESVHSMEEAIEAARAYLPRRPDRAEYVLNNVETPGDIFNS